MSNYWLTTHWPPVQGTSLDFGIYVCDGRQEDGIAVRAGDKVLIYESLAGPDEYRRNADGTETRMKHQNGRGGIVAIGEIVENLHCDENEPVVRYSDGVDRRWCWIAEGKMVSVSGFVPCKRAAELMGYNPRYTFRAIGPHRSGLLRIDEQTYRSLVTEFNANRPLEAAPATNAPYAPRGPGHGQGGEGPIHEALKNAVYLDPAAVLGVVGLKGLHKEYSFGTGDRADVILEDFEGRYIAVEVEEAVTPDNIAGVLQAIKYRYMYAVMCNRHNEEVRAFLVAHEIHDNVKATCARYEVECFEVQRRQP